MEGNEGIGETGAVHVDHKAGIMRECGEFGQLHASVNRPAFSDLRKRQGGRLDLLFESARKIRKHRFEIRWRDLACAAGNADELGASGEHFRRAALIFHDMGLHVAENRAERRRNCAKRKRVRGSSRVDKETSDLSFEDVLEKPPGLSGQRVLAIGRSRALVRGENRREDGLTGTCGVVAREIHGIPGLEAGWVHPGAPAIDTRMVADLPLFAWPPLIRKDNFQRLLNSRKSAILHS